MHIRNKTHFSRVKCKYGGQTTGQRGRGISPSAFAHTCQLKCVFISRIDCSLNLLPLYITVSRNTDSESEISAVNLIVG